MKKILQERKYQYLDASIGTKIKRVREHLELTQKQVGILCGFPRDSADVRIGQYERNKKKPRIYVAGKICNALGISEACLFDADLSDEDQACHSLFDLEDFYGLHPVKINGKYYLKFSGENINGQIINKKKQNNFLKQWRKARKKYLPEKNDGWEIRMEKLRKYDLWRFKFRSGV